MKSDVLSYSIVIIPGDNISPELTEAALAVLDAVQKAEGGFQLYLKTCIAGAAHYAKHGTAMTPEAIEDCRTADGVLKAPVGDPAVRTPEGIEAGLLGGGTIGGLRMCPAGNIGDKYAYF